MKPTLTHGHSILSSAFLPGRLTNLEILERLFPFQKKSVLELVLQGCNGELVKAIEQFLSSQETLLSQQPGATQLKTDYRTHPYLSNLSFNSSLKSLNGIHKMPQGGLRSAFSPFSSTSISSGIHSAFNSQMASIPASDSFRSPFFHQQIRASDIFPSPASFPYQSFNSLPTAPLPGFLSSPFSMHSYRPGIGDLNYYKKTAMDKPGSKSPGSDNGHMSDSWEESSKDRDIE